MTQATDTLHLQTGHQHSTLKRSLKTHATLCISLLLLTACGSDYKSNPIVLTEGSTTTVVDDSMSPIGNSAALNNFSQTQLTLLKDNIWQSDCNNNTIIELTFSNTERHTSIFTFSDANCTTLTTANIQQSIAPYTIYETTQDISGVDMTRIEFRTLLIDATLITRSAFRVEQDRLYLGIPTNSTLHFSTALDFNNPYYAITTEQKITIPTQQ